MFFYMLYHIWPQSIPTWCTVLQVTYQFKDFIVWNRIYCKYYFSILGNIFCRVLNSRWYFFSQRWPNIDEKVIELICYYFSIFDDRSIIFKFRTRRAAFPFVYNHFKSPASRLFTQRLIHLQIKENIKAPRHLPLCGEFTGTGELPAQRASNAENVSIWWRHHDNLDCDAPCSIPAWHNNFSSINPSHAETGILRDNYVNIMAAEAPVPYTTNNIDGSSSSSRRSQLSVLTQDKEWKYIFMFPKIDSARRWMTVESHRLLDPFYTQYL